MLQIFIYGNENSGFLDLTVDTTLQMESLTDIFDEDLSTGEFSLPIDIPWTDNNRKLMSFIERLSNFGNTNNYWQCDVYDNGYPELQHAKLSILEKSGSLNFTTGKFSASISGTKGLFGSLIKNKKLKDVPLGGTITFVDICRDFATKHSKGLYPQYPYIGFAPVAIENFFETGGGFDGEFLAKDTVNNIISTGPGLNDWLFGRPLSTNPSIPAPQGNAEFIDYRTIPFFKMKYVLQQVFASLGYSVTGTMLGSNVWDDLYIFNTTAIEFYSIPTSADYTRKIFPAEHVPDMLVSDFLKQLFSFFNIYPIFTQGNVELRYRNDIFTTKILMDITGNTGTNFTGSYEEEADKTGYAVDYGWDDADDYRNDRVKDITTKTLVATVNTLPNLGVLNIGRTLTTDDIVFVEAENMYYNVANATTTPVLWDAWSERLGAYKKGDGNDSINIGCGTLCNYVELDIPNALYVRRNRLGCRQNGSYWTNKYVKVKKSFSLRLFYIKKQVITGNEIPVSMNTDSTANGTLLNPCSLALEGSTGMLAKFHTAWLNAKQKKETIKIQLPASKKIMAALKACNTIQHNNVLYLHKKTESNIPMNAMVDIELKPL